MAPRNKEAADRFGRCDILMRALEGGILGEPWQGL
jgi:hypothetical protein